MKKFFFWPCLLMASLAASNAQMPTINEALDGPSFAWARLGNLVQLSSLVTTNAPETHDGVDGASTKTGSTGDSQRRGIQTRVFGPGTLSFWWKVSCEQGFDYFGFWIGPSIPGNVSVHVQFPDDPYLSITGTDQPWEKQTIELPPGQHYLEWVYKKDDSDSDGADAGYLDEVYFIPDPPTITNQPSEEISVVPAGTNLSLSVGFIEGSFPNVSTQTKIFWQLNGTNLPGKTNATLTLTNLQVNQSGEYRVIITNLYGSAISEPAIVEVFQPYSLESGLDTTGRVWTTGGDVGWIGFSDANESHDGVDAVRSGIPPDDYENLTFFSYLDTTVTGPGTIKFWWRLTGLDTDRFSVFVNTVERTNAPPEDGSWAEETLGVTAGTKPVRFRYFRDDFISTDDSDGAFLDQFRFIPATNAPPIFSSPVLTETGFSTTIQLDPSRAYTIQRSTNLTTWTNVVSFTSTDNLYEFIDPDATNLVTRYYRIKSP